MKLAICADLHFRGKKLQDKIQAWSSAVDLIIKAKCEMVVLAGDTFDRRNIADREATTGAVYRAFMAPAKRLLEAGIEVVAVKGNGIHEGNNGNQPGPLETLKETGIGVVDSPYLYRGLDATILFMPAVDNESEANELETGLKEFKKRLAESRDLFKLVVGHLTVRGAQLNSGIQITGTEFEVEQAQLDDLGADLVVLGHIHRRQWFGDKVCYVGALSQGDFGEEGNPQGFMIIDTIKRTHEFIEIEAPNYMTVEGKDTSPEIIEEIDGKYLANYIKVRFKNKPDDIEKYMAIPNVTIEIIPERVAPVRSVEGVEAGRSDADQLEAYMVSRGLLAPDRARIGKVARELAGVLK